MYYQHKDSLQIHMDDYETLKEASYLGKDLCQEKAILKMAVFSTECF